MKENCEKIGDLELKKIEFMAKKLNFYIFIAKFVVLVHLSLKKKFYRYGFSPLSIWSLSSSIVSKKWL